MEPDQASPMYATNTGSCVLNVTHTARHLPFALATAILFLLSWVFPIGAGLAKDRTAFPKWWGTVDVGVAFLLALAAFGIQMLVRGKVDKRADEAAYRIYRTFTHAMLAVAVLVMLASDRITWVNCATVAGISGVVRDPSGAVVQNAKIVISTESTKGTVRAVQTTTRGSSSRPPSIPDPTTR
jgi:hypothetical protein